MPMLERILGEREPSFDVVGIANWSNHSEIQCAEFSKKLKIKISLPKGVEALLHREAQLCSLLLYAQWSGNGNSLIVDEWIMKMCTYAMRCYSVVKEKETIKSAGKWTDEKVLH